MGDRPSFFDTLTGEPQDPQEGDWQALFAEIDRVTEALERYRRESDPPPEDPSPAAAMAA